MKRFLLLLVLYSSFFDQRVFIFIFFFIKQIRCRFLNLFIKRVLSSVFRPEDQNEFSYPLFSSGIHSS